MALLSLILSIDAHTHIHKCIDGHDSEVWLTLGVVHQVQIDEFLQFKVICLHTVHHIWEQLTKI